MWQFRMPYTIYFGGVCAFTKQQFETINGFSNKFYGWGGEDDEAMLRCGIRYFSILKSVFGSGYFFLCLECGSVSKTHSDCRT